MIPRTGRQRPVALFGKRGVVCTSCKHRNRSARGSCVECGGTRFRPPTDAEV